MNLPDQADARFIRKELKTGKDDLPDNILKFIEEKKLFKLFIPAQFGGFELPLPDALEVLEHCAWIDGDFGWQVNIGSGGGYFTGFMDPAVVRKYVTQPNFVIAGSGIPAGSAKKHGDNYIINGSWKYCSGSTYASLFTFSCTVHPSNQIKAFALLPGQVSVSENWDGYGLTATSSHTVTIKDAVVPPTMTFDITKRVENYGYKFYDYPFLEFARAAFCATATGCYRHLLDEAKNYSKAIGKSQLEKHILLNQLIAKNNEKFKRMTAEYESVLDKTWEQLISEDNIPPEELSNLNERIFDLIYFFQMSSSELIFYIGMVSVRKSSEINKVWRDLTTACQHSLLKNYKK